ncbi:hypothetical protein BJ741DRAFT_587054 [Chytriomyces cf. hyalinus JEL632]|nr:hypothetical protein BJ741DRAFT_587054 [Chytriomyces cf. hyalinus JEL632]
MALNLTGTYQLNSISQTAVFQHKDFNDGCINLLDIKGTGSNTTIAFTDLPATTVDCGAQDVRSRFSRYFTWVHNGAIYPSSYGFNTTTNEVEVIIGSRNSGYLFSYGKFVARSSTSTTTAASSSSNTATSTTGASTSTSTGTAKASESASSAAASSITPSVVYVAPSNSYVAPKSVPSNLYKGAATKESFSAAAAAIAAVFAFLL